MNVVWRDGSIVERRPDRQPGLACWGLFTTVGCDLGRPFLWSRHERRLTASLVALGVEQGVRLPTEPEVCHFLDAGGFDGSTRLRVVAFRIDEATWSVEASATPCAVEGAMQAPARLITDRWTAPPPLVGHKTLSRLPWEVARERAHRSGFDDVLLVDSADNLLETSTANIWVVHGGIAKTPRAPVQCLPGVMRGWLLEHLENAGLAPEICDLTTSDLATADEIWLSNAVVGVRRVASVDSHRWTVWPRFDSLEDLGVPAPGW
jgi:branched-subunit amino acid aminotransferase/4-amino-4-deoxychorismate lyase